MEMRVLKYESNVELIDIIGYENQVSEIILNGFWIGTPSEALTVEISLDKTLLTVYNENKSQVVGRIHINEIKYISFTMCEERFTLEQ